MNQMVDVDGIPFGSSLRLAAATGLGRKEDSATGGFDGVCVWRARRKSRSSSKGAQFMTRLRRTIAFLATGTLVAVSLNVLTASTATAAPFGYKQLNNIQKRLTSGLLASELNGADVSTQSRSRAPSAAHRVSPTSAACTNR